MKRAVITGLAMISPAGSCEEDIVTTIKNGHCPVEPVPDAMVPPGQTAVGALIKDMSEGKKGAFELLTRACEDALKEAGLLNSSAVPSGDLDCAVIVGTSLGDIDSSIESYKSCGQGSHSQGNINLPHELAVSIGERFHLNGPKITLSCACTSGTSAMGLALDWLRLGRVKRCLVAAVDTVNDFVLCGFSSLWALTSAPPKPFDQARTGMALGETAVAFLVEADDTDSSSLLSVTDTTADGGSQSSLRRIRAVIDGYGASCDAVHITAPDRTGAGAGRAIEQALSDAQWDYSDVEYLNVHATGSLFNDSMILKAIEQVFKDKAFSIPVSSVNPCTGHTLGAAGLAELLAVVLAAEKGFIPPTPNLTAPESEDINLVADESIVATVSKSISLTTGFGGANTAIAISIPPNRE